MPAQAFERGLAESIAQALNQALTQSLSPAVSLWGGSISWLELVASALALWMVLCNLRVNPLGWPLAMASSALYGLLFWHGRLYGEAGLQLVFIACAGWGWWQWLHGTQADGRALVVRAMGRGQRAACALLVAVAWPLLGLALDHWTDSERPYFDALPTAGSLLGQWLLGRKWIETWAVWAVVNAVSVALFATQGLWLTTALYALFAVLSVVGWRAWQRLLGSPAAR